MSRKAKISYEPLWNTMRVKNITTYKLIDEYGFNKGKLHRLKHGENTTLETVKELCLILNCRVEDVVDFIIYYDDEK